MTQYFQARARKSDGRFDYTVCTGSTEPYALGYCRGWREDSLEDLTTRFGDVLAQGIVREQGALRPFKDRFHVDGHATGEEAEACYREFQLDTMLAFRDDPSTQKQCTACGAWTTGYGELRGDLMRRAPLCVAHQTRADMKAALEEKKR